ncbi:SNF2 family N-terminal domain-containing protein [Chytriomyces cf. hyalinus JEL632]|nr:SNF2 family N-terminal domain-containing protein [Chytriomyces cf. hyalinus JEL632]
MGAGAVSDAGPSTAPLKRTLSRSATFEVNEDKDLTPYEKQDKQTAKVHPVAKVDKQQILLGTMCTSGIYLSRYEFEAFEKAGFNDDFVPVHAEKRPQGIVFVGYETNKFAFKFSSLSRPFRQMKCISAVDTTSTEFWLKITRPNEFEHKANLELQVRWKDNDHDSLKTPEALQGDLVARYWANGGIPFLIVDHKVVWSHNAEGGVDCTLETLKIPATFDIAPCVGPDKPFALELYDYQLRTLAWMQGIEDGEASLFYASNIIPLGEEYDDMFVDLDAREFLKADSDVLKNQYVRSGIIADKPGVGKTITTLALCHTRPFDSPDYLYTMKDGLFQSKATALFVPNNIAEQWEQEIRKCLGDTVSVIQIKGKAAYMKTSLEDILTCDYVIVSYQFLINRAYKGFQDYGVCNVDHFGGHLKLDASVEDCKKFVRSRKGNFSFAWVNFHRVVCDEFHEVLSKTAAIRNQIEYMQADSLWGLTGTPCFDSTETVCKFADFLDIDATETWVTPDEEAFRFIQNRVRRNEPDVTFPAPIYETFKCQQTPMERAFYQSSLNLSVSNLLKLCNHYQIGNHAGGLGAFEAMSIEKVTEAVQITRKTEIEALKRQVESTQTELAQLDAALVLFYKSGSKTLDAEKRLAKEKSIKAKINTANHLLQVSETNLMTLQGQYNFFENFVSTYLSKGGQKIECNICLDEDIQGDIGIVPCGHSFCHSCAEEAFKMQGKCPSCRQPIQAGEIMRVQPPVPDVAPDNDANGVQDGGGSDGGEKLDPDMFGSKIREMVKYIRQETEKSDDHRFIVFIQFSDLADLVSAALNTYGVLTARVKRGWRERENALKLFRAGLSMATPAKIIDIATADGEKTSDANVVEKTPEDVSDPKGKGKRVATEAFNEDEAPKKAAKTDSSSEKTGKKPVKVLMLSARDSVSGLNLTEASHCIILHPFYSQNDEHAIASEKQGVARVLRKGQEKTVKIVRFYVENTVEQGIHETRMRGHGVEE